MFASAQAERSYALVDDRRDVVVHDRALVIPDLDPKLPLASLAIESADRRLAIGACARTADTPAVTCATPRAAPGTYRIRLVYTTPSLALRAHTDLTLADPAHATVVTSYAIDTPPLARTGTLAIVDADAPTSPPPELARGEIELDGSTAIVSSATRTLPARFRRIYRGAPDDVAKDLSISSTAVWVTLELGDARDHALPRAPLFAHFIDDDGTTRFLDIPVAGPLVGATTTRIPLWIDPALHGTRAIRPISTSTDRLSMTIANSGEVAREVLVEEPLRPLPNPRSAGTKAIAQPEILKHTARLTRKVAPASVDRFQFVLTYGDLPAAAKQSGRRDRN